MTTTENVNLIGRIVKLGEIDSALPLEHTEVTGLITGPVASVVVTQRFGNPLTEAVDLEYLFPLPVGAAVTDFSLRLGERVIRGDLEEIERAKEVYDLARQQGKRAGLLEQRRPNLFAVLIANVLPAETILAEMRYQERVNFTEDGYEFVFPMGLTPKYDRQGHPEEGNGVHAPVARPGEKIGTVDLTLSIDTGVFCGDPTSPSHPLAVRRLDERRLQVSLVGEQIPDRDFVLRLPVTSEQPAAAGWCSPAKDGCYFLATILPPRASSDPLSLHREFIFVLDRSGSMSGEPILQARNALRACLRTLNPQDTFRMLLFDDQIEWYRPEPCPVDQVEVDRADLFLSQVDARGGTEIITALNAALSLPTDPRRTRFVVFLTDGAVSAEAEALEMLRRNIGSARIFTFGIGPSVNRALLARMARVGKGVSEFLQADEDIEGAVIRFQDRVSFPALTDLSLNWAGAKVWDLYPARLPDLFLGQALELSGRCSVKEGAARLIVRGMRGEEVFETALVLKASAQVDPAVARVWAKARVDDLLEEMTLEPRKADSLRGVVIGLALDHRLVTPYTAFVALDEVAAMATKAGNPPVRVHVSHPLPQGLDFGLPQAQPALQMPRFMAAAPAPGVGQGGKVRGLRQNKAVFEGGNFMMSVEEGSEQTIKPGAELTSPTLFEQNFTVTREILLREMARNQQLDGSWEEDVEFTATALLAFVRSGHTTSGGSTFRQVVRRAVAWLESHVGNGFASRVRSRALHELAELTGDQKISAAADAAEAGLGQAETELERAIASETAPTGLTRVNNLDALRLAGWFGIKVEVASDLVENMLARAWAVLVM